MSRNRYTAKDGHRASKQDREIIDYVNRRWSGHYQLGVNEDGSSYHLCTAFACCQFSDLDGLKQFLGEQWQN